MTRIKKILTIFIIFQIMATFYIVLTSKITSYRAEKQLVSVIYDTVKDWKAGSDALIDSVNRREIELSSIADEKLSERLAGQILLQVESRGEAWYVNPLDRKRYFLSRPEDAIFIIKKIGFETDDNELMDYLYFDKEVPNELWGRFVWGNEKTGKIHYFNPKTRKIEMLDDSERILSFLTSRGIGITNENIRKIPVAQITF